jgi:hypothetical protein
MNKEWICESCNYKTNTKQTYERHLLTNRHLNPTPTEWICKSCNYKANTKQTYERHLLSNRHLNPTPKQTEWLCKCCKYKTNFKYSYNKHLLSTKHLKNNTTLKTDRKRENPAVFNEKLIKSLEEMKEIYETRMNIALQNLTNEYEFKLETLRKTINSLYEILNPIKP